MPTSTGLTPQQPSAWRMPLVRNVNFTGRQRTLDDLRVQLTQPHFTQHAQALHGPGGIGKTQTAAEYAHRYRSAYSVIWWIEAGNAAGIAAGLGELARTLGVTDRDDLASPEVRRALFKHLASRQDWLLIFDDAAHPAAVAGMWPEKPSGHVLITSRSAAWTDLAKPFPIGVFDRQESIDFLLRRTRRGEAADVADRLAAALGDLPLALDQAAALIEQTRISFDEYLRRFETHWADLLREGSPSPDYPMSVAMSWELSFRQVESQAQVAAELLAVVAYLAPEGVPRRLFAAMAPFAPPALGYVLADAGACEQSIAQLVNFSLMEADERIVRMHPLACAMARDRLTAVERRTWAGVAARAMEDAFQFDGGNAISWREMAELLPHALAAGNHADENGVCPGAVRSIFNAAGQYLMAIAQYEQAGKLLSRAMEIARSVWGDDSSRLSPIANNLGRVMLRLGDVESARTHFDRALQLDERTYGPQHPHVAEIINNRGVCLHLDGRMPDAESDFRRALEIYQQNFGQQHEKIAAIVNNLGYSLVSRGELRAARLQFDSALKMAKATLGRSHPTVAAVLRNLGQLWLAMKHPADAKKCYQQAMDIDQRTLGDDHPHTAADLTGLAKSMEPLGELPRAKAALARAIKIEEAQPHPNFSELADRYATLSRINQKMGDDQESRRCKLKADQAKTDAKTHKRRTSDSLAMI